MKRSIVILLVLMPLLSSCDLMRALAGRPTSREIGLKREILAQERAKEEQKAKAAADSLALLSALEQTGSTFLSPSRLGGLADSELAHKYYVVIGAFRDSANAARMVAKVQQHGYEAYQLPFRNSYTAVGVCPSDTLEEVYAAVKKLQEQSFCPKEVWILHCD